MIISWNWTHIKTNNLTVNSVSGFGLTHQITPQWSQTRHWGWFSKVTTFQYLVCPPADWITARQRRLIDRLYRLITSIGMLFHSCTSACWSWRSVCGWTGRWRTRRSSRSHSCSIGERSGDFDGHSMTSTLFACRYCVVSRAVCGRALSCWKIAFGLAFTYGMTTGASISSL